MALQDADQYGAGHPKCVSILNKHIFMGNNMNLNCLNCNVQFKKRPQPHCSNKFCSMSCYNKCKKGPKIFWDNATDEQKIERLRLFFEKKVIRKHGCWDFKGAKTRGGYGLISVKGKCKPASRISWIIHNGSIPEGLLVLHKCDNPICTNPEHLFLGTTKDNAVDRDRKKRGANRSGINNGISKLTNDQIFEIRSMCDNLISYNEICDKFKISKTTISNIKNRKTWRHI